MAFPWSPRPQPEPVINITVNIEDTRINEILWLVRRLSYQGDIAMADLTQLRAAVEENGSVTDSVEVLVNSILDQIDGATSQEEIDSLVAELRGNTGELSQLVVTNTPAEGGGGGDTGGGTPPVDPGDGGGGDGGVTGDVPPDDGTGGDDVMAV